MSWLCSRARPSAQVHLQVGEVRCAAQEVVPHQAVEVVRRRRAGVALHVDDARDRFSTSARASRRPRGLLERRALGHVDDHLELALVVERQHLDRDDAERHERHRASSRTRHAGEKEAARRVRRVDDQAAMTRR